MIPSRDFPLLGESRKLFKTTHRYKAEFSCQREGTGWKKNLPHLVSWRPRHTGPPWDEGDQNERTLAQPGHSLVQKMAAVYPSREPLCGSAVGGHWSWGWRTNTEKNPLASRPPRLGNGHLREDFQISNRTDRTHSNDKIQIQLSFKLNCLNLLYIWFHTRWLGHNKRWEDTHKTKENKNKQKNKTKQKIPHF